MGAWSVEPFGNDDATDWAWELEDASDWAIVREALESAVAGEGAADDETLTIAVAAAEVVAHGLGRPTQVDSYTEDVTAFAQRVGAPSASMVTLALGAIAAAAGPRSPLRELWEGDAGWEASVRELGMALRGDSAA